MARTGRSNAGPNIERLRVGELWRYPVKSMAGENLEIAEVTTEGIVGDRVVQVRNGLGKVLTARTKPLLLGLQGRLGSDGEPIVNDQPWTSPEVAEAVRQAAGDSARLARNHGLDRFDVLPLSVLTDGAIGLLGVDRRRLRPNILIAGAQELTERAWPGRRLRIGEVIIGVKKLRGRCVMTTYDPDTLEQDLSVLKRIVTDFGGRMALDCSIIRGGRIAVGDPVELLEDEAVDEAETLRSDAPLRRAANSSPI